MTTKTLLAAALSLGLAACVTKPTTESGFIADYGKLAAPTQQGAATQRVFADPAALGGVKRVAIAPTEIRTPATGAFTVEQLVPIAAEIDRQLCLELAERFEIASGDDPAALQVRAAITNVSKTGATSSVISAAASRAIPGPGSLRLPVGLGGLAAEMEARVGVDGPLAAQLAWSRRAQIAMDQGSLSPIGDAYQAAEPFADSVGKLLTPADFKTARPVAGQCPDAPEGGAGRFIAGRAVGLYLVPDAAKPDKPPQQ
jgi:hypothetical protein